MPSQKPTGKDNWRRGSGWTMTVVFVTLIALTGLMFFAMRLIFASFSS